VSRRLTDDERARAQKLLDESEPMPPAAEVMQITPHTIIARRLWRRVLTDAECAIVARAAPVLLGESE
jgi:hypothetical protein